MGKKLLAAVLGGLAFFAWSFIAHMVFRMDSNGIKELPANEAVVLSTLQTNIPDHGMYFFPKMGLPPNATRAQQNAAMSEHAKKIASGPSGLLIYHPTRTEGFGSQLAMELGTNIVQVLLAVILLSFTRLSSFGERWRFVTIAGFLAAISTNISYWNWYGFPTNYTLIYIGTIAMGFVCAGLVVAAMLKPAQPIALARAA
jgi:hypothetical protein